MVEGPAQDAGLESPCIGVCQLDAEQVCLGCGRRMKEIAAWSKADPKARREILQLAAERRARMSKRQTA